MNEMSRYHTMYQLLVIDVVNTSFLGYGKHTGLTAD